MVLPRESHSKEIRSKNKSLYENAATGVKCSYSSPPGDTDDGCLTTGEVTTKNSSSEKHIFGLAVLAGHFG